MNPKSSPPATPRFEDQGQRCSDFTEEMLVVCPRCSGRAISRPLDSRDGYRWFNPRRLVCSQCSYTKEWSSRQIRRDWSGLDDYYHLPLWLQISCCGETLWAYNERHLAFLEEYVGATLRERHRDPATGWSNRSMASCLPQWMHSAKNRPAVLKGLARLRTLLPELA